RRSRASTRCSTSACCSARRSTSTARRTRSPTPTPPRASSAAIRRCGPWPGWSGRSRSSTARCASTPLEIVALGPRQRLQVEVIPVVFIEVWIEDQLEQLRAPKAAPEQAQVAPTLARRAPEAVAAAPEAGLVVAGDGQAAPGAVGEPVHVERQAVRVLRP